MKQNSRKVDLFSAAKAGDTKYLDDVGLRFDPDLLTSLNVYGDTPCHVAVQHGHADFALKIASFYPPALNKPNMLGDTPLHTALKHGTPGVFFHRWANLGLFDILHLCLEFDFGQIKSSARKISLVNREGKSLIYLAVEKGYSEVVSFLLLSPGELLENFELDRVDGPNGSTALHAAVRDSKYDIVQILLQYRRNLTEEQDGSGRTPLHLAVTMNDPQLVEMLVNANAYSANILSNGGISPFHLAVSLGHLEIFQIFLRLYPDCYLGTTSRGQNALHVAVQYKSASIVECIVKDKKLSEIMINQQDKDGNTPLHLAAYGGDYMMQNALLASSAKVLPLKNVEGLTFDGVVKARKEREAKEKREKMRSKWVKALEDFQNSLLVMTTLITTVTFTAAFTLPGGYNDDEPNKGMATLVGRAGFDIFLISNTVSLSSSIIATAALILFSMVFSIRRRFNTLKIAIGALGISLIFTLTAFASGVWLVIESQRRWLAILIAGVVVCTPLFLILLAAYVIFGSGNEDED